MYLCWLLCAQVLLFLGSIAVSVFSRWWGRWRGCISSSQCCLQWSIEALVFSFSSCAYMLDKWARGHRPSPAKGTAAAAANAPQSRVSFVCLLNGTTHCHSIWLLFACVCLSTKHTPPNRPIDWLLSSSHCNHSLLLLSSLDEGAREEDFKYKMFGAAATTIY